MTYEELTKGLNQSKIERVDKNQTSFDNNQQENARKKRKNKVTMPPLPISN